MLIGDQVKMKLKFEGPSGMQVIWPVFNDTILGNIIVIGRSKIDSSFSKDKKSLTLTQEVRFTSFDSGFIQFPRYLSGTGFSRYFGENCIVRAQHAHGPHN